MMRRLVLIPTVLVIWMLLCAWSADVPWNAPLHAQRSTDLAGSDFQARFGSASADAQALVVHALGNDGTALQSARIDRIAASQYPILRYRFSDFPATLELALVFRRSDAPDDVQSISLPAPGSGEVAVDLSQFAEWRGTITELGFAEYATAQLVPTSLATAFAPFRLEQAQLQSPSWAVVFARLRSDWFGYRPWSLLSISTIGPGLEVLAQSWMLPVLALGGLLSWLAAWVLLGWTRATAWRMAGVVLIGLWSVVDLRWLDDLFAKHGVTETLYARKPWSQREALQPDEATYAAAAVVRRLAAEHGAQRVLVYSDSNYSLLRLIYFLLPLNAAPAQTTFNAALTHALPPASLLVVYASDVKYDAATGLLGNDHQRVAAASIYADGDLRVFVAREASP